MTDRSEPINRIANWTRNSISLRLFIVGVLTLILLIPLEFVKDLINERANRQKEMMAEIGNKWGNELLISGPVLKIPYKTFKEIRSKDSETGDFANKLDERIQEVYVLPNSLNIASRVDTQLKERGIYQTTVFKSNSNLSGSYNLKELEELNTKNEDVLWDRATIIFQTSNLKGVNEQLKINLNGKAYHFTSKFENRTDTSGSKEQMYTMESQKFDLQDFSKQMNTEFSMKLAVNGSSQIRFVPVGKTTSAKIISDWKTNNFTGNFLPQNSANTSKNGMNAEWKVLDINRPFPQHFDFNYPDLSKYAFGVNFMIPVDQYQKSERTAKYGFLVIGLTFLVFFLIQTLSKIPIHPFQYLMIGLGLVMFYTLLLSISEHSNFLTAYIIAGIAVVIMISLYSRSILHNIKFPIFIGMSLTALYSFIYIIIQLENYALLVGSIGLFLILGAVMYVSRKIDWNNF